MIRDRFFTAEEARDYGLIDHVMTDRDTVMPVDGSPNGSACSPLRRSRSPDAPRGGAGRATRGANAVAIVLSGRTTCPFSGWSVRR